MKLVEREFSANRHAVYEDTYQHLTVHVEETPRQYLRFNLMEQRWRSKEEAASYLRWAAEQIEGLEL